MSEFLIKPILYAILMIMVCIGFCPRIKFSSLQLEDLCLRFCFGLGIFSLTIFFGGLLDLYQGYFFYSLAGIGFLLGLLQVLRVRMHFRIPRNPYIYLILVIMLWIFLSCLTPVYMYDSLDYHFSIPEQYLIDQGIRPHFYNLHSNMPFMAQMPWVFLLFFSNAHACKLFIFVQLAVLLLIQYYTARRVLNRTWSIGSIFVFLAAYTSAWAIYHVHIGNDITRQLYLNAAILTCLQYLIHQRKHFFVVSALLLGFTLGTKYFSIIFGIPTLFIMLLINRKGRSFPGRMKELFLYFFLALIAFSPWLIKQYIHTGNPIYPILYHQFPTKVLFQDAAARRTLYSESGYTGSALDAMVQEENHPAEVLFNNFMRYLNDQRDFLIFPGILACLAGLFVRRRLFFILSMIGFLCYLEALLLGSVHWYRYFVTNYTIIAIIFIYWTKRLIYSHYIPGRWRWFLLGCLTLFLMYSFLLPRIQRILDKDAPPLFVIREQDMETFYQKHHLGTYYHLLTTVNRLIPETRKILIFENHLAFGFKQKRLIPGMDGIYAVYHYFWENKTSEETLEQLWKEKIEFIIFTPNPGRIEQGHSELKQALNRSLPFSSVFFEDEEMVILEVPQREEWFRRLRKKLFNTFADHYSHYE